MSPDRVRYRFGPLERRGLIAGWRGGQIAAVATSLVVAVAILRGRPTALTVVGAVGAVVAGVVLAWWPIAGRTAEQWLPTVTRWCVSGAVRTKRDRSAVPAAGHCAGPDGSPCLVGWERGSRRQGDRPVTFEGLRILSSRPAGSGATIGVVHDVRARTYTAAMTVLGHSFALLGSGEKERRVSSWASVLTSLSRERSVVHRFQWLVSTVPDDGAGVDAYLAEHGSLAESSAALRSYAALLQSAGAETCKHDVMVAVQIKVSGSVGRAIRSLGGGDRGACAVLERELSAVRRQLMSADIPVERVLDARQLASVIRDVGRAGPSGNRTCPPCGVAWPWPLATKVEWGCVRTDGAWHATYWIAEWPRIDVGPEFLAPLLLGSVRRSVTVVMEPQSPARAVRQAEKARTADIADAELRRRGGFLSTARRAREAELANRREEELADGHASFRFVGYVTVSAGTKEQLAAACDATEQAASQCRLELRRLYGDQARAYTCTLPLARGLA
jgi:hypothetical protein